LMNKGKKILFYICVNIFLVSCETNSEKTESTDKLLNSEQQAALLLYELAMESSSERGIDEFRFSRSVAKCYLTGVIESYPINFIMEQRNASFEEKFRIEDPLNWNEILKNGGYITIEKELNLLVLESAPNKKDGRVIHDVVIFNPEILNVEKREFYKFLGEDIKKSYNKSLKLHRQVFDTTELSP